MKLLSAEQILGYIKYLEGKHRATLETLKNEGKTYRTRDVTKEIACLNILLELQEVIIEPQRAEDLRKALGLPIDTS